MVATADEISKLVAENARWIAAQASGSNSYRPPLNVGPCLKRAWPSEEAARRACDSAGWRYRTYAATCDEHRGQYHVARTEKRARSEWNWHRRPQPR